MKERKRRRAMKEEHRPKKRETGWCMCLDILDVRWIGARASTLVTILMRLLYDVTFNGAPRPLPSGHNSPTGPSGFFRHNRQQTEKNRNDPETRIRLKTNTISRGRSIWQAVVWRDWDLKKNMRGLIYKWSITVALDNNRKKSNHT